jgi:hypothetical protein
MQTIKQLLSDLKKAKAVFGYVAYNNDDGTYLQMVKADIVFRFKNMPQDTTVRYTFDGGLLHIN